MSIVQIELCLVDGEHEDGVAWRTTRLLRSESRIPGAARKWLQQVQKAGAPVYCAMYRFPGCSWVTVW